MRILAVGVATLDVVNLVASYPREDEEVRAVSQRRTRGGNATNTLVVLSQLGHRCHWAGTLVDEPDSRFVLDDLRRHGIDSRYCLWQAEGKLPTSYVTLSRATGSRSIVHYRDLPEFPASAFAEITLDSFDWVHFEGRNVSGLARMLERVKVHGGPRCSLEVEKPRDGMEALFQLPDILLFSRQYAMHRGYNQAQTFLESLSPELAEVYCAWGEEGAWVRDNQYGFHHSPAYPPPQLVDTLGAGDVFNAGIIHARDAGKKPMEAVEEACRLAGKKCGSVGLGSISLG